MHQHTISVRVSVELVRELDAIAARMRWRRSALVRALLLRGLAELELIGPVRPIDAGLRTRAHARDEPCSRTLELFAAALGEPSVDARDRGGA